MAEALVYGTRMAEAVGVEAAGTVGADKVAVNKAEADKVVDTEAGKAVDKVVDTEAGKAVDTEADSAVGKATGREEYKAFYIGCSKAHNIKHCRGGCRDCQFRS